MLIIKIESKWMKIKKNFTIRLFEEDLSMEKRKFSLLASKEHKTQR